MWHRNLVSIFAVVLLMNSWLYAVVIPGRWEKVETLKQGSEIIVALKNRDIVRGEFGGLGEQSIRMIMDGRQLEYQRAEISRISQIKIGWSRKKKAGVGALIGFPLGFALGYYGLSNVSKLQSADPMIVGSLFGTIFGGIGAGGGFLSKQTSKEIVIYEARSSPVKNKAE